MSHKMDHDPNVPLPTIINWSSGEQELDYVVVSGAHAFILRASSYFGLAPLRFVRHPDGFRVSLSKPMCVYSYTLITILVALTMLGNAAEIGLGLNYAVRMKSRTTQVAFTCEILMVVITASAGVYGTPKRMKNMLKFMNSLALIDKNVGGPNLLVNERTFHVILHAMLPLSLILLVNDYCYHIYVSMKSDKLWNMIINYTGYYLVWQIVFILEVHFVFAALTIRARFAAINNALAVAVREVSNAVFDELRATASLRESINQIAVCYGILYDVVQGVNDSYGLPLIVIIASILIHLIVTSYFLIIKIITSTDQLGFCIIQAVWCIFNVLRAIVIVDSCHRTVQEGKRTEWLMCRLINDVNPEGLLSKSLQLFLKQLMLQSINYSPLGMFTLDRTLLTSAVGAITTYLVILIQFQRNDK